MARGNFEVYPCPFLVPLAAYYTRAISFPDVAAAKFRFTHLRRRSSERDINHLHAAEQAGPGSCVQDCNTDNTELGIKIAPGCVNNLLFPTSACKENAVYFMIGAYPLAENSM